MPTMKSQKVSKPTLSDYTPQTAAPMDPNAISELRFKLLNAGSPVPAVHALPIAVLKIPLLVLGFMKICLILVQNSHLNWLFCRINCGSVPPPWCTFRTVSVTTDR